MLIVERYEASTRSQCKSKGRQVVHAVPPGQCLCLPDEEEEEEEEEGSCSSYVHHSLLLHSLFIL